MKDLSSNQNNYPPVLPFTLVKISVLQSVLYEEWELKTCVLVRTKILSAISLKYRAKIDRQNEAFGRSARLFLLEICRNYICSKYATFIENSLALRHIFLSDFQTLASTIMRPLAVSIIQSNSSQIGRARLRKRLFQSESPTKGNSRFFLT